MNNLTVNTRFHGLLDTEIGFPSRGFHDTKQTKHITVLERDLSYRFFPHFHPFVGQLAQRLLARGVSGLQAADTEYTPDDASMPASVEFELKSAAAVSVPAGAKLALLADLQVTLPNGATLTLAADSQIRLAADAAATAPQGLRAMLVEGLSHTPAAGSVFTAAANSEAFLLDDAKVVLNTATLAVQDGEAPAPAGTQAVLPRGARFVLAADTEATLLASKPLPVLFEDFFRAQYQPDDAYVQRPYPVKDLDFTLGGAYAVYNWEIFFHVPLTIAMHLSKNQRFAEAQRWFHYLFDPTDDSDGPSPERFWKVRPFQSTDARKIEEIFVNLATGQDEALRNETIQSIEAWEAAPFRPHVVARYRQQAYMVKTVMAYLDNLIAWGDALFRQDTGEAIDEATMLYILAADILGPRPQPVPEKGQVRAQTYTNLRRDLNKFGTVLRDVEAELPFDLMPFPADDSADDGQLSRVRSLGKALYFCVPRNDKLVGYWDTVADRLFKIRNSLNLQGAFRQLALFAPPIDPALLARAAASGLDVAAIVNGLNQPLPLVRFQVLVQKANEIVQEVKSLGNNLLSAMEKEDGEALAVLRAKHERAVMAMVEVVKYGQLQDTVKAREGLLQTLALSVQRYVYYQQQLGKGKPEDIRKTVPDLADLDQAALAAFKLNLEEPALDTPDIEVDIAQDLGDSGGKIVSSHERQELDKLKEAQANRDTAIWIHKIGSVLSYFPEIYTNLEPLGAGSSIQFGGSHLSNAERGLAAFWEAGSDTRSYEANRAGRIGSYDHREQEWEFQSNLAAGEINQIFKQLRAAQIREAIAEQELKSHRLQMQQADEIGRFLNEEGSQKNGKVTNKALYTFMKREVKGLYAQCFQLAFDVAKKAERALQHELGDPCLSYLQFGYLAGKEGLLAGEKLYFDVKRMELAYLELNRREYELTKHVSLLQVDPLALIQLRATGRCTVRLPEEVFDMDGPGHYFRRIKSVALSIPCVTGPFASVNCKLTLLKSSIRITPVVGDGYARADAEDERFSDYFGSLQSIVASSAQNDSGLFETNLRDERYLPFENSGAISEWELELPADPSQSDPAQFDYETISDVILHMRYTAREGGDLLRKEALAHFKEMLAEDRAVGAVRLFSVRHEFPTEWAKFKGVQIDAASHPVAELSLTLREEHYPYWSKNRLGRLTQVELFAKTAQGSVEITDQPDGTGNHDSLNVPLGSLRTGKLTNHLPAPTGKFSLYFNDNSLEDLWLAVTWSA